MPTSCTDRTPRKLLTVRDGCNFIIHKHDDGELTEAFLRVFGLECPGHQSPPSTYPLAGATPRTWDSGKPVGAVTAGTRIAPPFVRQRRQRQVRRSQRREHRTETQGLQRTASRYPGSSQLRHRDRVLEADSWLVANHEQEVLNKQRTLKSTFERSHPS